MEKQLVVFRLAKEFYGVDIQMVESIIRPQTITAPPQTPDFVEGVTNLRSEVLPVMNLHKRFHLTDGDEAEPNKEQRIIIVNVSGLKVGMIVDAVSEVLRLPDTAIEPPSLLVINEDSECIEGIAKFDERLIILLNLGKVITQSEKSKLEKMPIAA